MNKKFAYYHHPAMKILRTALQREWQWKGIAAWLLLFGGIAFCLLFFRAGSSIFILIGLVGVILGIKYVRQFLLLNAVDDLPLLQIFQHHPQKIVWVYSVITERMPFGFQFSKNGLMYFKLVNGEDVSVSLSAKDLKLVSKFLNRLLPHATFGYSEEKEQKYLANPELLIREKKNN